MNTTFRTLSAGLLLLLSTISAFGAADSDQPPVRKAPGEQEALTITVGESLYKVNGRKMTMESLIQYLNTTQLKLDQQVQVVADPKAQFERVANVLELLEKNGLKNVKVQTKETGAKKHL